MGGAPHGRCTSRRAMLPGMASDAPTPVMVVDDHPAVREGLCSMLEIEPDLETVAVAGSARDALAAASRFRPAVAVVDYHLPDEDGLALCLRLKGGPDPPAVLVYSAFADETLTLLAAIAGADGLVSKSADPEDVVAAVRAIARNERLELAGSAQVMQATASRLDSEDLPVLGMLMHRTPPAEIAETLNMSEEWLTARRWAMLEGLRGGPSRRARPARSNRADAPPASPRAEAPGA